MCFYDLGRSLYIYIYILYIDIISILEYNLCGMEGGGEEGPKREAEEEEKSRKKIFAKKHFQNLEDSLGGTSQQS